MNWVLKNQPDQNIVKHLQEVLGINKSLAILLAQRDITNFQEAKCFFRPSLDELHDPFLLKDMSIATKRIMQAIDQKEKIMVYGDYDVDGTTSVALVFDYLRHFTEHLLPYIPDRYKEGYGLSYQGIDYAAKLDVSLIISLDCGIKAVEKVDYANEKGIDMIIGDHHLPGEKVPDALAVIDPKQKDCAYPFKELCGCGIGFKLISALNILKNQPIKTEDYLDLVAIAIGADIVPINGENRILAFHGLEKINNKPRPGIQAMIDQSKKKHLSITDVVFILGPRINAAGRMEHGSHAVELLLEKKINKATEFSKKLEVYNTERKETDKKITSEAKLQIEENQEHNAATTVVYSESWHKGVIGIVASRLIESYYRPTLVFTKSGDHLAASARSVKGFDVYNAIEACADHLVQFGGHKYAAGLTLKQEQYSDFKSAFEHQVAQTIPASCKKPQLLFDIDINFEDITPKFIKILKQFAPFGPANQKPLFRFNNVKDTGFAKKVGKDGDHLKCHLYQDKNGNRFDAIGFGLGDKLDDLKKNPVDIVAGVEENEWNGVVKPQLNLKGIKNSHR
jgi:single-stranded-DNA-specific exonuclease